MKEKIITIKKQTKLCLVSLYYKIRILKFMPKM
jgi:hypothetical protein